MATAHYIWHRDAVRAETDSAKSVTARYSREPDQFGSLVSEHRSGDVFSYHYDASGSTTELSNSIEAVTDTLRYSAFGSLVVRIGATDMCYMWDGKLGYYAEDSPMYYVRRRFYCSSVSRWLSADSTDADDKVNGYRYARNLPVVKVDPTGLAPALSSMSCAEARQIMEDQITRWRATGNILNAELMRRMLDGGYGPTDRYDLDPAKFCSAMRGASRFLKNLWDIFNPPPVVCVSGTQSIDPNTGPEGPGPYGPFWRASNLPWHDVLYALRDPERFADRHNDFDLATGDLKFRIEGTLTTQMYGCRCCFKRLKGRVHVWDDYHFNPEPFRSRIRFYRAGTKLTHECGYHSPRWDLTCSLDVKTLTCQKDLSDLPRF